MRDGPHGPGIYAIQNLVDGRVYVGGSVNIAARWGSHRCFLRKGSNPSWRLQKAWDEYGEESFVFKVLELIKNENKHCLIEREEYWIDRLNASDPHLGYNFHIKANRKLEASAKAKENMSIARKGVRHDDEWNRKIKLGITGFKRPPYTDEQKEQARRNLESGMRWNGLKTHCPQGHPYSEENTIWRRNSRECRKCKNERGKRWRENKEKK